MTRSTLRETENCGRVM